MAGGRSERTNNLFIDDDGLGDPTEPGQIRHTGSDLKAYVGGTVKSLTTGTGISEGAHDALDQLVHRLAETNYLEVTRTSGRVTNVTVWTTSGKTKKVREVQVTRSGGLVSQVVEIQYDATGTEAHRLTMTVNRTSNRVSSIDTVRT